MTTRPIIIIGSPSWGEAVRKILESAGYSLKQYSERTGYVTRLVNDLATLILVNGDTKEWEFWATAPKTSPATRRIPVVVIGTRAGLAEDAARCGADRALTPDALIQSAAGLVNEIARVPDEALLAELDCQCQEPMPAEGLLALAKFDAGEYYEQHDRFEHLWMVEQGPVRDLYRAILQVGVAYYQVTRGNLRGARKMLLRSIQWLALLPDTCQGVDVAQLSRDADSVRDELDRIGDDAAQFDKSLLKGVRKVTRNE